MFENLDAHTTRYVLVTQNAFIEGTQKPCALVINGGKIEQVADVSAAKSFGLPVYDVGDHLVTAGLHDAHQHVFHAALFPSALADEYLGKSEEDYIAHMQDFAKKRPGNGWLLAHGWREGLWDVPKVPTKQLLSEAFPDRPVALYSGDSHTLWLNQKGLDELALTDESTEGTGGSFDRDSEGHLTGVLREATGMTYVAKVLARFSTDELIGIYEDYFKRLNAIGITSVCDMALSLIPGADGINPEVYLQMDERNILSVRSHLFPTLTKDISNLEELKRKMQGAMVQAPAFKQFFDGVSSQHTAWVGEAYENARFAGDVGRPTVAADTMRDLVLNAAAHGHATRIHTIGDEAVHRAILIYKEALETYGAPTCGAYTLEHVEDIRPEDIELLSTLPVVVSTQPAHITIDLEQPAHDLGAWRARRMWPYREMLDANIALAFGSDAPVVPPSPEDALYVACTRKDPNAHLPEEGFYPEHNISCKEALLAYTEGSAKAVGREHELGKLAAGYLADIVVWSDNLLEIESADIQRAHPLATFVGGKTVYVAN